MMPSAMSKLVVALALVLAVPAMARGQNAVAGDRLSDLLPNLYLNSIDATRLEFERLVGSEVLKMLDQENLGVRKQLDPAFQLVDLLGSQVSSFPLGSSAGGFSFGINERGEIIPASESFGPTFVERALTNGRGNLNVGVTFQRATFDQMEGKSLAGGAIKTYTGVTGLPRLSSTDTFGVFVEDTLDLRVTSETFAVLANYGVTDRFDVGVAIPVVHLSMTATLTSTPGDTIDGLDTQPLLVQSRSGSATGVGDIVVRGKYRIIRTTGGGLSGGVDARLPTGDELDLLGLPGAQVKFYAAASATRGAVSPHLNFGVTLSGESQSAISGTNLISPTDELNYSGGADVVLTPRATVALDLVGRTLRGAGRLDDVASDFGEEFRTLEFSEGNTHLLLGAAGFKVNPWSTFLVTATALFPLGAVTGDVSQGLSDDFAWALGGEFSF